VIAGFIGFVFGAFFGCLATVFIFGLCKTAGDSDTQVREEA
jgi:hypothetical protein